MKVIVRRTALAVCTLVLAVILSTAASAACIGFDDVPETKAQGTDASPRMRR